MSAQSAAERYLGELRRITAGMAGGQRLQEVLDGVTRGLRRSGRLTSVSVSLYAADGECPICRQRPPLVPSGERRLHRVGFDADREREPPAVFHAIGLGERLSGRAARERRVLIVDDVQAALRETEPPEIVQLVGREGINAGAFFPLVAGDDLIGVLSAYSSSALRAEEVAYLEVFALQAAILIRNAQLFDEVEALKERLSRENAYLDLALREEAGFGGILGQSEAMRRVLAVVRQVAPVDTTVLLTGETGTGKELIARAIHDGSARAARPMIKVNCGAIPASLADSEFFGHERGAFTGAHQRRIGRFELADRGTIFLDEVGELALDTQVRLLRVLQERELQRVGGERSIKVDVRVLAATNRDLSADVTAGRFRSDVFYRLNVLHIRVPPLRERREDIPALALHFGAQYARRMGKAFAGISTRGVDVLVAYEWPGNIRELQNVIERACVLSSGPTIEIADPASPSGAGGAAPAPDSSPLALEQFERRHILLALEQARWRVEGVGGAADLLELKPSTLRSLMKRLQVVRPAS